MKNLKNKSDPHSSTQPTRVMPMINQISDRVHAVYESGIGTPRRELITPALILDLDVVQLNIDFMKQRLQTLHAKLRPHIKVQKSPELARMQIEAGAIGVCTATVWEAIVMSRSGIEDVLIANEIVGNKKIEALANAAKHGYLTVAVDDSRNADAISQALSRAGSKLDFLIEVDVGMGRGGVRSPQEAVALANQVKKLPGLRFRGVQGYEGHCMLEPDRDIRVRKTLEAMNYLGTVVDHLKAAGFVCEVVSSGGTGTYDITGADPRVTEIQAGSYVFMDNFHGNLVPGFSRSLTVLGTVIIQHGDTIVFDCGHKSIGIDHAPATMVDYPSYRARYFAEEHALFDVDDKCKLKLGDTMEFIPGYAPSTVNLYDAYHVVRDGIVVDIWPIIPRGPGHIGLIN